MKTELTDKFEDIEVKIVLYRSQDDLEQEFAEYMKDAEAVEKDIGFKTRSFEPRQDRPEASLKSYGPSEVVVEYLCGFLNWEGSQIIRASVRDGAQAQRFLEHCLNSYGRMPIRRKYSFSDIPFQTRESENERRTLNLVTGAEHPQIMWKEMYNIFVDELNGRDAPKTDKPTK